MMGASYLRWMMEKGENILTGSAFDLIIIPPFLHGSSYMYDDLWQFPTSFIICCFDGDPSTGMLIDEPCSAFLLLFVFHYEIP